MASAVNVSVEAIIENQIQEVTLDGQEIYVQPLSMSENLTKLAHKIDFSKDESEEKGKPTSEGEKEVEEEKPMVPFQPSLWPWDSVRNKLKAALTEVSVLLDVLNVVKEKRYMVLDMVSQDPPDPKNDIQLLAKKRSLANAAQILLSGADRLRRGQTEISTRRLQPDFHQELLKLRQNWRLKKVGNVILGDLSYKSSGSRFGHRGTFEVRKSDIEVQEVTDVLQPPRSALQVTVPSELEGVAYIQVSTKRLTDSSTIARADLSLPSSISGTLPHDAHWQRKLEGAQNVIYCKEVFAQLAREAVQLKSAIPHLVVGNQIFCHLLPGVQLSIALCHNTDKDRKQPASPQKKEHNPVLEHSLHQLLREVHFKNIHNPTPHPVTAMIGVSKKRRLAGPHAYSRRDLIELSGSSTLLEQIIKQTKHTMLRENTLQTIDSMACTIQDPQISAHLSCVNTATESAVKVIIVSSGFEMVRTALVLQIEVDQIKAIMKDGRVVNLSNEEQELRDFILCQIAQHQATSTVQQLAKVMGWQLLAVNTHLGVGDMEPVGNAASVMIASPNRDKVIAIRSGPTSGIRLSVQTCPKEAGDNNNSNVVRDQKWQNLGGPFKEIPLDKLEGKNFVNKMEMLMARLVSQ